MENVHQIKEKFDESLRHDRAAKGEHDAVGDRIKILRGEIDNAGGGLKDKLKQEIEQLIEEEKKKLTSFIMKRYVGRWLKGLAAGGLIPVAGFLPTMTALLWWFIIKIADIEIKGVKINVSLVTSLHVWFFVIIQFLYAMVVFVFIYILVNPVGVGLDALGL